MLWLQLMAVVGQTGGKWMLHTHIIALYASKTSFTTTIKTAVMAAFGVLSQRGLLYTPHFPSGWV